MKDWPDLVVISVGLVQFPCPLSFLFSPLEFFLSLNAVFVSQGLDSIAGTLPCVKTKEIVGFGLHVFG